MNQLRSYIVSYGICDAKRLRKTFRCLRGYGDALQISVFWCDLDQSNLSTLKQKLSEIVNNREDQVIFVDIGPAKGRGRKAIKSLGKSFALSDLPATVV